MDKEKILKDFEEVSCKYFEYKKKSLELNLDACRKREKMEASGCKDNYLDTVKAYLIADDMHKKFQKDEDFEKVRKEYDRLFKVVRSIYGR